METASLQRLQDYQHPGDHCREDLDDKNTDPSRQCLECEGGENIDVLTHDGQILDRSYKVIPDVDGSQLVDNTHNADGTPRVDNKLEHSTPIVDNADDRMKVPDGGYGWFIVLGCFIMHIVMGGLDRSEGVFFLLLQDTFGHGAQLTAWPGSIVCTLQLLLGPLANALCSKYSVRTVVILGGLLMSLGLILNCSATSLYFVLFSHAIVGGVGRGLVYAPALIIVGMYFDRRVGLAAGLGTSGVGIGTFIIVPLTQHLSENYGLVMTYLIMGGVSLNMLVAGMLFRPLSMHYRITRSRRSQADNVRLREESETLCSAKQKYNDVHKQSNHCDNHLNYSVQREAVVSVEAWVPTKGEKSHREPPSNVQKRSDKKCPLRLQAWLVSSVKQCFPVEESAKKSKGNMFHFYLLKEPPFLMFCVSIWLFAMAFRAAFTFMPALVKSRGIPESEAAMALSTAGAVDTIGRIVVGLLLDTSLLRPHRLAIYNMVIFCVASVAFILPSLTTIASFCIFCGLYGLFTGAFISQKSVVLVDLLGQQHMASSFGLLIGFQGVGSLLGPPLAGALRDSFGSYDEAFYLGGGLLFVSGLLMVASNVLLRLARSKKLIKGQAEIHT